METLFIIYVTVLGFVLGSFLNVVSLRFNTGKSLSGRSMCFSCGKKLSWHELVPVLSWLLQRGRCRGCSSRIPVELLASEILCGSFFTLIALRGFFTNNFTLDVSYLLVTIYLLVVFCILCVVFFYDLRHQIIPDELSGLFAVITFIGLFFFDFSLQGFLYVGFHIPDLWQVFAGVLVPLPFFLIWLFSGGRLIGLGDPKLMVGMGWIFGVLFGFSAVFLSFYIGALCVLAVLVINKLFEKKLLKEGKKGIMNKEIPFGPFLILGTLITAITGWNILFW